MSVEQPVSKNIVITGDETMDWNLICFQPAADVTALWNASTTVPACPQPGGAALLYGLIGALCKGEAGTHPTQVHSHLSEYIDISAADRCHNHSFTLWRQMGEKDKKGWRVSQFLGIDPASTEDVPYWLEEPPRACYAYLGPRW